MSSFQGQVVVVLGATGVVGAGVARSFLDAGATVLAVSRDAGKLEALKSSLGVKAGDAFEGVVGAFDTDASAAAARDAIVAACHGHPIDHVVSSISFVTLAKPPTESPLSSVKKALDDGLFNSFLAAKVLLPLVKNRAGASYTLVSGGLAHQPPPSAALWLGTLKNASVIALGHGLAAETAESVARVNTLCVHMGVAPIGGQKNQLGVPAEKDSLALGPAFLNVAAGKAKGQLICLSSWDDVSKSR